MDNIVVKTEGLDKALRYLKESIDYLNKKIPYQLQESGNAMVMYAKHNHRFNHPPSKGYRPSGNAERSITADVDAKNWVLKFYLDPSWTTLENGQSYVDYLHEGTGDGYKKSSMADKYSPSSKGGIKADHFMVRAYEHEKKNLEKAVTTTLKKAFK